MGNQRDNKEESLNKDRIELLKTELKYLTHITSKLETKIKKIEVIIQILIIIITFFIILFV